MAVLPFFATSCKKKVVADFDYYITYSYDHATCITTNGASNADYYEWTLYKRDGEYAVYYASSSEISPYFDIYESGEYRLELKAYNSKYSATVEKYFNVSLSGGGGGGTQTAPTASFNLTSSNGNYAPTTVYCNNTSTNATHYHWTLTKPDYTTSTSTSSNPSFTCNQTGTYTVKLIAYNANNVSSTLTKSFTLTSPNVTITYLQLIKIPMLDSDNSSWDTGLLSGADPDIYFKIVNSSSSVIYTSATKENVAESDLPVTWYSINQSLDYGSTYYIKFYDEDGSLDSDDLMANCIFNSSYMTTGSSSYTWEATDGTIKFVVGLSWGNSKSNELELTPVENDTVQNEK